MRRPHDIRKKLKQLQRDRIRKEIDSRLRVCPKNCKFNQMMKLGDDKIRVSICTFGQHPPDAGQPIDISKIILCNSVKQAEDCNARIPRYRDEEEARVALEAELRNPKTKMDKFPEIVAMEWVLDDELHQAKQTEML